MKKQFQILSIVATIIFFSCGRHNAEITGEIPAAMKELSTNSSSLSNETDLFLIGTDGELRFNADPGSQSNEPRLSVRSRSCASDRRGVTKTFFQLNESFAVN